MTNTNSLIFLALLTGCNAAAANPEKPREAPIGNVDLYTVIEQDVPRFTTLVGTLRANREADIAADSAGKVVLAKGERGERVEKGTLLARLDADDAALAREEAKASADAARAQDKQASKDCERADRLYAEAAISAAEHDKRKATCDTSSSNTTAADVRVKRASKALSDSLIRAPFSGVIAERHVELGEHVGPGTRIVTLVDLEPMRIELKVPEAFVGALAEGATLSFAVPALGEARYSAELDHLAPSLSAVSRDLVVEARVTSSVGKLRPGMFVTAFLPGASKKLPVVPLSAVAGEGPSRRVFVVKDGALEERVVLVGAPSGKNISVESGLAPGEHIAREVKPELKDGARLAVN